MQTSEKKSVSLKSAFSDHCNRLQQKYQQQTDLLEDLRIFMRQRTMIEKIYAQSLNKLVQQSLAKHHFTAGTPPSSEENLQSNKLLLEVWKSVLDETSIVASARLSAADSLSANILEQCKQMRTNRATVSKMAFEHLSDVQKDIFLSVHEMTKTQKVYREEEHVSHDARNKARIAVNKLQTKSTGPFTTLSKLQQQCSKMNARLETCEVKSTAARNEYILNLVAANAHLWQYYNADLPELMKILDGDYFDTWKKFLSHLSETEIYCSNITVQSFNRILSDAEKISREYDHLVYVKENSVLTDIFKYDFVPQDNDPVCQICKDHQAQLQLDKEARKWAAKIAKENRNLSQNMKKLTSSQDLRTKMSNGSQEAFSSMTISRMQKEDFRVNIRKAEIGKVKAQARIEALRAGGIDVDVWLNSSNLMEEDDEELANGRKTPASDKSEASSVADQSLDDLVDNKNVVPAMYPVWCVAVYDYQAVNEDELTIAENENLELIEEGEGDGWVRARNSKGAVGLVPENYIRMWNPVEDAGALDANEVNVDDGLPSVSSPNSTLAPDATERRVSRDSHQDHRILSPAHSLVERWARAIYDYDATCEDELSFQEGQLIRITSTEHNGVDDGWWEGEVNGTFGTFPSLVVEELLPVPVHNMQESHGYYTSNSGQSTLTPNREREQYQYHGENYPQNYSPDGESNGSRPASENFQYLFEEGTESAV